MDELGVVGCEQQLDTFAQICARKGMKLLLWEAKPGQEELPENVRRVELEALSETPLILFLESIDHARESANRLGDVITGRHVVAHACRDLEVGTGQTVSQILKQETSTHRIGFITGPMRPVDVTQGLSASATVYSRFPEVHEFLVEALVSPTFRLYRSDEIHAAEIAAAYTRIIAFVWGVAQGMEQGASVGATLFARGLAEIARVVSASGGAERAVFGMSGAGNLFADVAEPFSLEVLMGRESVRAGDFEVEPMQARFGVAARHLDELISTCSALCAEARIEGQIGKAAAAMVSSEMDTVEAARYLMTLPVLDE